MSALLPFEPSLGAKLANLWDNEVERIILGSALLGDEMPRWLAPRHFFPAQHQRIYEAVQSVGGNVAHVNTWLRESAPLTGPLVVTARELAAMCFEAEHARLMGWALDFACVLELWRRRQLLEACVRTGIKLASGGLTHEAAVEGLKDAARGKR